MTIPGENSHVAHLRCVFVWLFMAFAGSAHAAQVSIDHVSGFAGQTVTTTLQIDTTPLDAFGLFTLDLELVFDPGILSFTGARPGNLAVPADFFNFSPQNASPGPSLVVSILASFTDNLLQPEPPGGGILIELDFFILPGAQPGQRSDLDLTFSDANTSAVTAESISDGSVSVTVIPLPGAIWFMITGLAWVAMLRRTRLE